MKVCVLGAGVVGVTTASVLSRAGHDVTLIDKASAPSTGTSRANGAQLAYSYVEPMASPATAKKLLKYFLGRDPGIKLGLSVKPSYWTWGLSFLRNCLPQNYRANFKERGLLAKLSRQTLSEIETHLPDGAMVRTGVGKLVIADNKKTLDSLLKSANTTSPNEDNYIRKLDRAQCIDLAPSLKLGERKLYGGIYCATDEALDTQVYCKALLSSNTTNRKPKLVYNEKFVKLELTKGRVSSVVTSGGTYGCDAVIACLGGDINQALTGYINPLPIYPVQGYSVTLPATKLAPQCSITDLKHKFVIANLGDRVRIAGFMDANLSATRSEARAKELLKTARRLWPGIANYDEEPNFWVGQRPMTPDGLPIIRESQTPGLFINAGHGSMGYTFAAGSAAKILDLIGPA